jgi:hypothetical protein
MWQVFCVLPSMPPFLCKRPSTNPRVLDVNDCPPHNLVHDITSFPTFYDPLYYPDEYPALFATADGFCGWFESALMTHLPSCQRCRSRPHVIAVSSQPPHITVCLDGTSLSFTLAHLESPTYRHCSIFERYEACQDHPSMQGSLLSSLTRDPPWLSYPIDHHREAVSALPATVLRTVARVIGCDKSQTRRKDLSTEVILRHFDAARLECSGLSDDVIAQRFSAHLPSDSLQFRATYLAAGFAHMYGADVAAALRRPLIDNGSIDNVTDRPCSHSLASWLSLPLDELTRRLERLSREDIQSCIRSLPRPLHILYNSRSHRKSCNALANYARQRAMYLAQENIPRPPLCGQTSGLSCLPRQSSLGESIRTLEIR